MASTVPDVYKTVATSTGKFAMLAIDQRESLRVMLRGDRQMEVPDQALIDFKVKVTKLLSAGASALLIDPLYGLDAIRQADALAPNCGLLVAVDDIVYDDRGSAVSSVLLPGFDARDWRAEGAAGLKFLLLWSPSQWSGSDAEQVQQFIRGCKELGVLSLLEVVVKESDGTRPGSSERQASLSMRAAEELSYLKPDLYKTEVPYLGDASDGAIIAASHQITDHLSCPWIVLSSGVKAPRFPDALSLSCRGGASGFLAGRAVWGPAIGPAADRELRDYSLPRLRLLNSIVEASESPEPARTGL